MSDDTNTTVQTTDEDSQVSAGDQAVVDVEKEIEESDKVAETLLSLQNLIERNANELDRKKQDLKELRQQLKNVFDNDVELSEKSDQAQQITQAVKERKQSIDNRPEVRQLKLKMADVKEETKEIEETLNDSCINLFQLTGTNSFDTSEGDQREFTLRAKVKSKRPSADE